MLDVRRRIYHRRPRALRRPSRTLTLALTLTLTLTLALTLTLTLQ